MLAYDVKFKSFSQLFAKIDYYDIVFLRLVNPIFGWGFVYLSHQ